METRVPGGYAVVTVQQLANLCALKSAGRISFAALRVWLAAVEQKAKRCVAKNQVRFTHAELSRLCGGLGERTLLTALYELRSEGLLLWSEEAIAFPTIEIPEGEELASQLGTARNRPVPLPRRIIRLLAKHRKPAEVLTAIAHLIRCLFKRGRGINLQGFVRAEWVADVFGVSIRAVHAARAWLLRLDVLTQLPIHQYVMNKHGALFKVSVGDAGRRPPARKSAGLLKRSTRSCTSKNQIQRNNKPAVRREAGFLSKKPRNITLSAIVPEDLRRLTRLEVLYRQAVAAGWIPESESSARNFIAAAVRATRVSGDAVRIFVGLVKKKLWHHITQEQENRALEAFAKHERRTGRRFGEAPSEQAKPAPINELVTAVLECRAATIGEVRGETCALALLKAR